MKFLKLPIITPLHRIIAVSIGGCIVVSAMLAYALFGDRSHPLSKTTLIVVRGTTFSEAAEQVEKAGIASAWELRLFERLRRHDGAIAAGEFVFAPHLTVSEVYNQLKSIALPVAHWVTIPEGFTATQIGRRLTASGFSHARDFVPYALHHSIEIGGVKTPSLEGYLFPSTYLLPDDADASAIAAIMVAEFRRQVPYDAQVQAAKLHATVPQVITVASLIEREAKRDEERPLMAGVYYHRLLIGMPLEVDATLEYAFASHHTVISASDLEKDTPYNSYKHFGLPPTPIANPGLPSILAALHPVQTPYLYYVYRGGGRHAFAATLQEHNKNVTRYLR